MDSYPGFFFRGSDPVFSEGRLFILQRVRERYRIKAVYLFDYLEMQGYILGKILWWLGEN